MHNSPIELVQLLKAGQVEHLLNSLVEIAPSTSLVITDPKGNILLNVGDSGPMSEALDGLNLADLEDGLAIKKPQQSLTIIPFSINLRTLRVGYIIGITRETDRTANRRVIQTTHLAHQLLTNLVYKEYELNSLSTDLINKYEEITLLFELSQDLGAVFDISTICQIAMEKAMRVVSAQKAYLALMDEDRRHLTIMAAYGFDDFVGHKIPADEGISGRVATSGKTMVLQQQEMAPDKFMPADIPQEAILAVPLILPIESSKADSETLGVIVLIGKPTGGIFTAGEAKLLTTIMTQISVTIHNTRLVHALQEAERIKQQIEIAARIQQSLLPKSPPQLPGIALAGRCIPAANVGGDYYDIFLDEKGYLNLLIADASGHSIGSALMMALARSNLRFELALGKSLDKVLVDTNSALFSDLIEAEMFISMFCARYNPDTHELSFANAGHNPPLLWRAARRQVATLDTEGLILGVDNKAPFEQKSITLQAGDILVLYTDGVIEARNLRGEQFSQKKLERLLAENISLTPDKLIDIIYQATHHHIRRETQQDDITLLAIKVLSE
jgi:serine phosphatase RsbU (regulator of sigma subunit)